jgi:hypothetical protein
MGGESCHVAGVFTTRNKGRASNGAETRAAAGAGGPQTRGVHGEKVGTRRGAAPPPTAFPLKYHKITQKTPEQTQNNLKKSHRLR